jgi:thymidylate synthase (FAD)
MLMKVNLVGSTEPKIIGIDNLEEFIAYCAKVSNPQFQNDFTNSKKLLSYLIEHKHWSPFEMASITLEIETTRDIARQVLRHRSFSFQEFSQRYKEVSAIENPFVVREARYQDNKNRQDSVELNMDRPYDRDIDRSWRLKQQQLNHETKMVYQWALDNGIAKEVARSILPEGNTVSRLYMQGNVRSWIHYIELRSGNGTQKEHMLLAHECARAIAPVFPMITQFITESKEAH